MSSYELIPAFAEPVADSQRVFRVLLKALSEPGLSHVVTGVSALAELNPAAYAVALTVLDSSTAVWLSPAFRSAAVQKNLAFHTGCTFVERPEQAMFAFLTEAELESVALLNPGTDRDPEFSCTAIVQLRELGSGSETIWSGPGIAEQRRVRLTLDPMFWQVRSQKNHFPRGVDVLFVAQNSVLGLPRTTQVQPSNEG